MSLQTITSTPSYSGEAIEQVLTHNAAEKCEQTEDVKYYSEIDPVKEIDVDHWAVSIAIEGASFHTVLFIEGVRAGGVRLREKCHLMGLNGCSDRTNLWYFLRCYNKQGYVEAKTIPRPIEMKDFKPNHKTWVRTREKVEAMRALIYRERDHREESPFCILGSNSLFSQRQCVVRTNDPDLCEIQEKDYPHFQRLCRLAEERRFFNLCANKLEQAVCDNTFMKFIACVPDNEARAKIMCFILETGVHAVGEGLSFVDRATGGQASAALAPIKAPLILGCAAVGGSLFAYIAFKAIVIKIQSSLNYQALFLIESREHKIRKIMLDANNCFTWARKKLEMVEVKLKASNIESFIAIPNIEEIV